MLNKLIKWFLVFLMSILVFAFLGFKFLLSDYNPAFKPTEVNELVADVKRARPVGEQFVEVYNQVNPILSTADFLFHRKMERSPASPCLDLASIRYQLIHSNNIFLGNRYVLALMLEKKLNQEECLNCLVNHFDFLNGSRTVYQAARYYFGVDFDSLTVHQQATLVVMMKNPALYNPERRPELIEAKLEELDF